MIVGRLAELNYRVRVLGGRKSVVVHHNRLKPRDEDPTVPVADPDTVVPSSAVSSHSQSEAQRPSTAPRFAALGGNSTLPPPQDVQGGSPASPDGGVGRG